MNKVMIIDNDATSLAIGRALLETKYEVLLMRSGVQALGFLENNPPPDIILLDLVLPGIDGMEVLSILKKNEKFRQIPVIFLTGKYDTAFEIECLSSQAVDFIEKPISQQLLLIKLKNQLNIVELANENQFLKSVLRDFKAKLNHIAL